MTAAWGAVLIMLGLIYIAACAGFLLAIALPRRS